MKATSGKRPSSAPSGISQRSKKREQKPSIMYGQGYVDTITNSFCTATNIVQGGVSVHTQERLWWRDFCDGAKLRRVDLESGESHFGWVFRRTTKSYPVYCEHSLILDYPGHENQGTIEFGSSYLGCSRVARPSWKCVCTSLAGEYGHNELQRVGWGSLWQPTLHHSFLQSTATR